MKVRVKNVAWPNKTDIDADRHLNVMVLDGLVKSCVANLTATLKSPSGRYSELQAGHMSSMFDAMGMTHVTIRNLLREESKTSVCVDATGVASEERVLKEV